MFYSVGFSYIGPTTTKNKGVIALRLRGQPLTPTLNPEGGAGLAFIRLSQ